LVFLEKVVDVAFVHALLMEAYVFLGLIILMMERFATLGCVYEKK
jgi:hypothetical protein